MEGGQESPRQSRGGVGVVLEAEREVWREKWGAEAVG